MNLSVLLFLLILTLSSNIVSQTRANTVLDVQLAAGAGPGPTGSTRSRMVKTVGESTPTAGELEQEVFTLVNAERNKNGLNTLEWNESLADLARLHSRDMASRKFFGHRGSDGSMVDDRADRIGLGIWRSIGENIAYMRGYDGPAQLAVQKWLESTAHRKNLLGATWKESAIGVAIAADGTYYFTEVFLLRR